MVKRGGTKRKIPIEKITKKLSIPSTFTKRRDGLFSKASQLCLLSGAQIAILVTPLSSESNVSFYSFGHSSVDDLVSAYLSGQRHVPVLEGNNEQTREDVGVCLTRKDLGLGNWWEDESLNRSENPEELSDAMDSMWTLLSDLKGLKSKVVNNDHQAFVDDNEDLKKNEKIDAFFDNGTPQEPNQIQTLILQSTTCPAIPDDDFPENYDNISEEQCQINAICESFRVSDYSNTLLPQENNNAALPESYLDYAQDIDFDIDQLDYIFENLEEVATDVWSKSQLLDADLVSMQTTTDTMMSSYLEGFEDLDDLQFPLIFPTYQPSYHFQDDDLCNFSI